MRLNDAKHPIACLNNELGELFNLGRRSLPLADAFFPDLASCSPACGDRAVDVRLLDKADRYEVHAALPGFSKKEISLEVKENRLGLSGERNDSEKNGPGFASTFSHSVALPEDAEADKAKASLTNGVLVVTLPKAAKSQPLEIKIS
tara:strand:+ start:256 stop:696 length:441 start_codon:yes stop_codon:yes gene_type:complete